MRVTGGWALHKALIGYSVDSTLRGAGQGRKDGSKAEALMWTRNDGGPHSGSSKRGENSE